MSTITLRRRLPASVEAVFDAWTSGSLLARWFVCVPTWRAHVEVDVREGGTYRIEMFDGERRVGACWGRYVVVERPHRLVFTWSSEGAATGVRDTMVTVTFTAIGGETELLLVHEVDEATEAGRSHAAGWAGCLACLATLLRESATTSEVRA